MGIDFSYEFYVHRRDADVFLAEVAKLCDPELSRLTTILLPSGTSMTMPGTYGFIGDRAIELEVAAADRMGRSFDLSLSFPVDGPLRDYDDEEPGPRVTVGYIYLSVSDDHTILPDHLRFDFMPATTGQSRLFLMSPSVRETFATLALTTGTTLCLLDTEMASHIVVTALGQRLSTRVPGPLLLWSRQVKAAEAFRELSSLLAGNPVHPPKWIIGPAHPDFPAFVESLADYAKVPPDRWLAP
ncbi:hypothetical protein [Paractinoplanes atraurantiacus]|nr:hypothetical protein [Actinoplanes atraurantiacus]